MGPRGEPSEVGFRFEIWLQGAVRDGMNLARSRLLKLEKLGRYRLANIGPTRMNCWEYRQHSDASF